MSNADCVGMLTLNTDNVIIEIANFLVVLIVVDLVVVVKEGGG